ncbi:hypothetical protein P168DRAFT_232871 [Aspergillus campestris IBT 28561]|uniref:Zn(2)-C6 fungal-type domain-containing protein n=1 Tax=Aspergillus campestris (strain IBT 28561) TaxID=1392248 RepID=A0A2I1D6P7_ASPC2|nr:uncharacterized protein P168DRAFT_232871 [Aspergillus campestris IBT 28561]PKY05529.1 hypothetical protein P168DRAFT_232871 [Aspergillus campestris IBT 28561]
MQAVQYEQLPAPGGSPTYADHPAPHDFSPLKAPAPKNVAFELLLDENKARARIPMRVQIYPHDTTDSIVTTVKNFYGIYEGGNGVSFEDDHGTTLIARYENLRNNMTVYVRVIPLPTYAEGYGDRYYGPLPVDPCKRPSLGEPFQLAQAMPSSQAPGIPRSPSRPASRLARKRSISPSGRSRRSVSQHKPLSRAGNKSRGSSTHGSFHDDAAGYSDSDGGYGSVSGTKKTRSEQLGSSDISMENILQDGRRKRPKFDSSELPLFAPPQVPLTTSTSSISPQRRSIGQEGAISPFARPTQRPYTYQHALPSPQSYGQSEQAYRMNPAPSSVYATPMVPDQGHGLRDRTVTQSSGQFSNPAGPTGAPGILPTPDPTIASCISDEDVAMQLIRLGDASNFSHGRTSASTLDDAFSGAADAASSTGATSEGEDFSDDDDDLPARGRQKLESSPMLPPGATKHTHKRLDDILPSYDSSDGSCDGMDDEYHYHHDEDLIRDGSIKNEIDNDSVYRETAPKSKKTKIRTTNGIPSSKARPKPGAPRQIKSGSKGTGSAGPRKVKPMSTTATHKPAMSPPLVSPAPTRKASTSSVNFQPPLAADEEDLSTKPRCQRCRKSKKGCDRQRPCGRCKDAGIGVEGCISEDEGNGRKGRYGRHMGVPVKKSIDDYPFAGSDLSPTLMAAVPLTSAVIDKNKKRKR